MNVNIVVTTTKHNGRWPRGGGAVLGLREEAGDRGHHGRSAGGQEGVAFRAEGRHELGTRSVARVEENTAAADLKLTGAGLAAIREILPAGGFGARYAEAHMPTWT